VKNDINEPVKVAIEGEWLAFQNDGDFEILPGKK
jgi:hypothetical protein